MSIKADDRIYETSTTTGTGTYTLAGAATGFQAFSAIGANNYCHYLATDGVNWEVGLGKYVSTPDRLERTSVLSSSNGDAAVDWATGTRNLYCVFPAAMMFPGVTARSSNTILGVADHGKTFAATSTFTQTLAAAATLGDGWKVHYRNNGTGVITLDPDGSETINGSATLALQPGNSCTIVCNGSAFLTVGGGVKQPTRTVLTSGTGATYTTPTGATRINVLCKGGGGNGNSGGAGSANGGGGGGGGGGEGGTAIKLIGGPAATYTYTVGGAGSNSTFGSLTGNLGQGGAAGSNTPRAGIGGSGGAASGGDYNIQGAPGQSGDNGGGGNNVNIGGLGGSGGGQGGGIGGSAGNNGAAAGQYGAGGGGGGGGDGAAGSAGSGGAGSAGVIIVDEYYD